MDITPRAVTPKRTSSGTSYVSKDPHAHHPQDVPAHRELTPVARAGRRSAILRKSDGRVIGGAVLLPLPSGNEDLETGWQLHPDVWGNGYASETTHALATCAFGQDVYEIFAVVQAGNTRAAATVRDNGNAVGRRHRQVLGADLQVFRLRVADLDRAVPRESLSRT